jgi:integrase
MSTIRFVLRTDKTDKGGKAPIELIYQISGQRKCYNTGIKLVAPCWDPEKQRAVYLDKKKVRQLNLALPAETLLLDREVQELNGKLDDLVRRISTIEKRFELNGALYSVEMVVAELKAAKSPTTKKDASSEVVLDFIHKYIEDHKATREPGSLTVYKALNKHLRDFQCYHRQKVTFENIDYAFFHKFQNFLISGEGTTVSKKGAEEPRKPLNNTTVAKQLSTLKTFLNYAKAQGIAVSDRYKDFKIRRETLEVIALTNEEFEALFYFDLSANKRLAQVRDVFCFACTTSLRYSDLRQLKREHIKADEIRLTVKKTREPLTVPLTPYSRAILSKYRDQHYPLPVISNQRMNVYLKELCKKAGIDEPIEIVRFRGIVREATTYPKYELVGVHTGRKTFATLSLERGMSIEVVMAITGHKDYKSFERYVKVTEQRKKEVMAKAWGDNLSNVTLKAVV